MAELAHWIWTNGALLLGRTWIALAVLLAIALAAGWIHSRIRPQLLYLDESHPYVRPHDRKDTRT